MSESLSTFLSEYNQYVTANFTSIQSKKLFRVMKKIVEKELPSRDVSSKLTEKPITETEGIKFRFYSPKMVIVPNKYLIENDIVDIPFDVKEESGEEELVAYVLSPDWGSGWRDICENDDFIHDEISNLMYLIDQYYYRNAMVTTLGSISIGYNRIPTFYGAWGKWKRYLQDENRVLREIYESYEVTNENSNSKETKWWLNHLNGFDPYINRIIFQFIKGKKLLQENFMEEAVVSFDNVVSISCQLLQNRIRKKIERTKLISILELGYIHSKLLDRLYKVRNKFGAHASTSKWWDFSEIYDGFLGEVQDLLVTHIYKVVLFENENRKVYSIENKWSEWFITNANDIFESVWFHKLP